MRSRAEAREWPFYLYGLPGRGKSFVAACVYARWSGTASMMSYSAFVADSIRISKDGQLCRYAESGQAIEVTEAGWWRHLETVGLLVLDEIGAGSSHEWRNELFLRLLELRKGRPLILTGNIEPDDIAEQFDPRIQSRIFAGALMQVTGRDHRMSGLQKRVLSFETDGAAVS